MDHTPGPWLVEQTTVYALTDLIEGKPAKANRFTAHVQSARQKHEAQSAELLANARLMAAAPRLLSALIRMCKSMPIDDDLKEAGWNHNDIEAACAAYDHARHVISQAIGEQS